MTKKTIFYAMPESLRKIGFLLQILTTVTCGSIPERFTVSRFLILGLLILSGAKYQG